MSENTKRLKTPATVITMGLGNVVVGHAVYEGLPCVIFTPVEEGGAFGADATGAIPTDRLSEGAVCIRFSTMESVLAHLDRVKSMVEHVEHLVGGVNEPA